ncbi:hypothetical protein Leryth_021585 [Lithospermum erythrorhizon]|nr:hypothetical protein Leryth_021585 [Lithospermum erythrorhizon]
MKENRFSNYIKVDDHNIEHVKTIKSRKNTYLSRPSPNLDLAKIDPPRRMKSSTSTFKFKSRKLFDPEAKRKQRVASYNAYTVESKIKKSICKSFRWMKKKYVFIVYGY